MTNPQRTHTAAQQSHQGRNSKIKRRRVEMAEPDVDCGGPQRAAAAAAVTTTTRPPVPQEPPSVDPTSGKDGWEPYGTTGLLHANHLALFYDSRTSTFLRANPATGELIIVPRAGEAVDSMASANAADAAEAAADALALRVGTETWVGRKETNEDRYVESEPMGALGRYFAVYDGHAGAECAEYVAKNLHTHVRRCLERSSAAYQAPAINEAGQTAIEEHAAALAQLIECREQQAMLAQMEEDEEVVETRKHLEELIELQMSEVATTEAAVKAARAVNRGFVEAVQAALRDGCRLTDQSYVSCSFAPLEYHLLMPPGV